VEASAAWTAHGAEVAGGDRAAMMLPHACGRALAGIRGLGSSWAASKRAL
jgi:hypothetical protein